MAIPKLTWKIVLLIEAVALVGFGTYAGYFHDQSIKGVYTSFQPQISSLQSNVSTRDAQISSLSNTISNLNGRISNLNVQISDLNGQISSLKSQASSLQGRNEQLNQQVAQLNQQVSTLQDAKASLQTQLDNLQAQSLDGVFSFTGGGCFFGCSATVRGAYVNYGMQNARNVVVTLKWSKAGTFVQSNTINIGVVPGRSAALYPDTSYTLSSQADHLDWSFQFTT